MSAEAKANDYLAQGEKALKKTSFFSFGSSSQRNEDASDLFEKAGNQFKIAKNCELLRYNNNIYSSCSLSLCSLI